MALRVVDDRSSSPARRRARPIPAGTSVRAALAESLWSRRAALPVSRDGVILGRVTRAALEAQGARP